MAELTENERKLLACLLHAFTALSSTQAALLKLGSRLDGKEREEFDKQLDEVRQEFDEVIPKLKELTGLKNE